MKIIVPMAGMGKRMRPHTLATPKPLLPIAGKPIVQRLVEDIASVCDEQIEEVAYVIGDFGKTVEEQLVGIAERLGAKGSIHYQKEALGTAHAVLCAAPALSGKVTVAFADTLFKASFQMDELQDGIIWVKKIDDPSSFGVVNVDEAGHITDFVEKPKEFVSDLAIIGIYYFKDGDNLRSELQYLIDNNVVTSGEYQLTDALQNMKTKGIKFSPGAVEEWLDCGNKDATVNTNQRILEFNKETPLIDESLEMDETVISEPCYIGKNVVLKNSQIGPHASIGDNTIVENSVISNSIIMSDSNIRNADLHNSMVGNFVELVGSGNQQEVSIGDYSTIKTS